MLSAAGLLLGLLRQHPELRPSPTRPLPLWTEEDESMDIMHGVGLAASSKPSRAAHDGATGAETTREGRCPAATRLAKAQLSRWRPKPEVWLKLSNLFGGATMARLHTTGIADALYARACHGMPLPCGVAGGCVDGATQRAAWRDADAFYCERFAGGEGGLAAAKLAMLPLLVQLTRRLEAAAAPSGHAARLVLFSGHDTVVAPLLASLGGLSAPDACRWPPYASHLTFELWEGDGGRARSLAVRVLFNGRAITRHLSGCAAEYCPLDDLRRTVAALTSEFTSACGVDTVPT